MLVLSRKNNESVVVGCAGSSDRLLTVTVLGIKGGQVRLGFEGDVNVPIHRLEVWERMCINEGPESLTKGTAAPAA